MTNPDEGLVFLALVAASAGLGSLLRHLLRRAWSRLHKRSNRGQGAGA